MDGDWLSDGCHAARMVQYALRALKGSAGDLRRTNTYHTITLM
jgi:hypothetical protein